MLTHAISSGVAWLEPIICARAIDSTVLLTASMTAALARPASRSHEPSETPAGDSSRTRPGAAWDTAAAMVRNLPRSEEHTSELQSLMRNSYAVFCLKKKKNVN